MLELTLGKIKNKDLAEWFGITYNSFRAMKTKKLKELETYCDFYMEGANVVITSIYDKDNIVYSKGDATTYEYVKQQFSNVWKDEQVDTCTHIAAKLYLNKPNNLDVDYETMRKQVNKVRKQFYGIPRTKNSPAIKGSKGECEYVWVKMYGAIGTKSPDLIINRRFEELNESELKIFFKGFSHYYKDLAQAFLDANQNLENSVINYEQAWEQMKEQMNFNDITYKEFIAYISEKLECDWIVRATKIHDKFVVIDQLPQDFEF